MSEKTPKEQLFIAVEKGNQKEIEKLMKDNSISANVVDEKGHTLLHHVIENGQVKEEVKVQIIKLLIQKGASIYAVDKLGDTPLHHAAACGHKEVAELLVNRGAQINAENNGGGTPLYVAASFGSTSVVEFLIAQDANVNEADKIHVYTPLHVAAQKGYMDIVKLLESKADLTLKDKYGKTSMYYLCNSLQKNRQISVKPNVKDALIKSAKIGCTGLLTGTITLIMFSQFIELPPSISAEAATVFSIIGKISFSAIVATAFAAIVVSACIMSPSTEMQIDNNVEKHVSHKMEHA